MLYLLMMMILKIFLWIKTQVPMTNITPSNGTKWSTHRLFPLRLTLNNKRIKRKLRELLLMPSLRRNVKPNKIKKRPPRKLRTKLKLKRNKKWFR
jgi:hypothetical protein